VETANSQKSQTPPCQTELAPISWVRKGVTPAESCPRHQFSIKNVRLQ